MINRKMKKTFWNEYIKASKKDKELLRMRNSLTCAYESALWSEFDAKVQKNLQYLNSIAFALRELVKPNYKHYNYKLGRKPIIGKIYRAYYIIHGHTFKHHGPITIIGKTDSEGNVEYPNTRWNRITK